MDLAGGRLRKRLLVSRNWLERGRTVPFVIGSDEQNRLHQLESSLRVLTAPGPDLYARRERCLLGQKRAVDAWSCVDGPKLDSP